MYLEGCITACFHLQLNYTLKITVNITQAFFFNIQTQISFIYTVVEEDQNSKVIFILQKKNISLQKVFHLFYENLSTNKRNHSSHKTALPDTSLALLLQKLISLKPHYSHIHANKAESVDNYIFRVIRLILSMNVMFLNHSDYFI